MPYIDRTDFGPQLAARLEAVEAEHAATSAELVTARKQLVVAEEIAFQATARYNHFVARSNRAARQNIDDDLISTLSVALDDELDNERRLRDVANGNLTRCQKHVANLEWKHKSLRLDFEQLGRAIKPPPEVPRLEIVKRPPRVEVDIDDILPPARGAA